MGLSSKRYSLLTLYLGVERVCRQGLTRLLCSISVHAWKPRKRACHGCVVQ